MSEYINAWECIGCGKLEAPADCVGICQDRRVQVIHASRYEEVKAQADYLRRRSEALEGVVRQIAGITPRNGEWERSYKALQERAKQALAILPEEPAPAAADEAGESELRIR